MKNDDKSSLLIVYTAFSDDSDSEQITLPIKVEDIYEDGVIDRTKVISRAASNEAKNNRSVLNPVVMDLNGKVIG